MMNATASAEGMLQNHFAPALGELDLAMISHVPPGGNWQHIPDGLSRRVDQIRSRSKSRGLIHTTYYGRLVWDAPSYTINTYFSRPGNGCFIHPSQDRVISAREAARLQSFPDRFVFFGTQRAIATQIGNAVPPLLGAQIASVLPGEKVVDLFSGAGGLTYGLGLSGKRTVLAVDADPNACKTYRHNHPDADVWEHKLGSATSLERLVSRVDALGGCDLLVGGPPCQSFSTAGRRSSDERSTLVYSFVEAALAIKPPTVVIENVLGIKSFQEGRLLKRVIQDLERVGYSVSVWDLKAEQYGVPQRRRRVFVVGSQRRIEPPPALGPVFRKGHPFVPTVRDAIGDLPPLQPGVVDDVTYAALPRASGPFQSLMRSEVNLVEYVELLSRTMRPREVQPSLNI